MKINAKLKWIFVQIDEKKYPFAYPNHACLVEEPESKFDTIGYGIGFSGCSPK